MFAALSPSDCRLCGAPLENISRLRVCSECISAMQPISVGTCAIGGEELASRAPSAEIQTLSACIPRSGSQRRGFNQAEFIARATTRRLALPGRELTTNRLARQRATASQIGLTRPQRAEEIRGAFRVAYPGNIAGRGIWLIDRVLPTGTTASERLAKSGWRPSRAL